MKFKFTQQQKELEAPGENAPDICDPATEELEEGETEIYQIYKVHQRFGGK